MRCEQCKSESGLNVSFGFTAQSECCEKCHHLRSISKTFVFCNLKCFSDWFEKIQKTGIPCWGCNTTGFDYGFESNGVCILCNGEKYLNGSKMIGFAQSVGESIKNQLY
jgi:hypothetical protein